VKIFTCGMLKTYIECPSKYNLIYNEKLQIPSENNFSKIGNEIHALINYFYKGFDIKKMTDIVYGDKSLHLTDLWDNFLEIKPDNLIKSEYSFNIKISDNSILTGRIDGLYKTGKSYTIVDWKTGSDKLDVNNDMQTMVYLYSLFVFLKNSEEIENFDNLSIEYYFLKTKKVKKVRLTETLFNKTEKDIISLTNKILAERKFLKASSVNCTRCEFRNFCQQAYEQV